MTGTGREMLSCKVGQLVNGSRWYKWMGTVPAYNFLKSGDIDNYQWKEKYSCMPEGFFPSMEDLKINDNDYANDIELAMKLLLEYIEPQCYFALENNCEGFYTLYLKDKNGKWEVDGHGTDIPLAICAAIIKGFKRGVLSQLGHGE